MFILDGLPFELEFFCFFNHKANKYSKQKWLILVLFEAAALFIRMTLLVSALINWNVSLLRESIYMSVFWTALQQIWKEKNCTVCLNIVVVIYSFCVEGIGFRSFKAKN